MNKKVIVISLAIFIVFKGYSQEPINLKTESNTFIGSIGFNQISFIDTYLSDNKYSGSWPNFSLEWIKKTPLHFINIGLSGGGSNEISNYNLYSDFSFGQFWGDYMFILKTVNQKFQKLNLGIGPGLSYQNYWMSQILASPSPTSSEFDLISLNFTGNLELLLGNHLTGNLMLKGALISQVGKKVDLSIYNNYKPEWLTIPESQFYECNINLLWIPTNHFGIKVNYAIEIFKIDKWNKFQLLNQNIALGLIYSFKSKQS